MRLSTPVLAWAGLSRGRFSSRNVVLEDGMRESRRVGNLHHPWKLEKETAVRICKAYSCKHLPWLLCCMRRFFMNPSNGVYHSLEAKTLTFWNVLGFEFVTEMTFFPPIVME